MKRSEFWNGSKENLTTAQFLAKRGSCSQSADGKRRNLKRLKNCSKKLLANRSSRNSSEMLLFGESIAAKRGVGSYLRSWQTYGCGFPNLPKYPRPFPYPKQWACGHVMTRSNLNRCPRGFRKPCCTCRGGNGSNSILSSRGRKPTA